jgi:hypothetical protein
VVVGSVTSSDKEEERGLNSRGLGICLLWLLDLLSRAFSRGNAHGQFQGGA